MCFCSNCGTQNSETAKFCEKCGKGLAIATHVAAPPPPPQPYYPTQAPPPPSYPYNSTQAPPPLQPYYPMQAPPQKKNTSPSGKRIAGIIGICVSALLLIGLIVYFASSHGRNNGNENDPISVVETDDTDLPDVSTPPVNDQKGLHHVR